MGSTGETEVGDDRHLNKYEGRTERLEIKPYLVDGITDEVLLQRINVAASLESKRQKKTDPTKNVRFHKIGAEVCEKEPCTSRARLQPSLRMAVG